MTHVFFELFAKRTVLIIDVEVVFLKEVVGNVDIFMLLFCCGFIISEEDSIFIS